MSYLLLFSLLLQAGIQPATPAGEPPAPVRGAELQLLEAVRGIAERVETTRQQRFRRPPVAVRAPDAMREVAAEMRALNVLTHKRRAARGRSWSDVGLGGETTPELVFRALATDLAGIGFDPPGNRLLVAPDRLTERDFSPELDEGGRATLLMMTGVRPDEPLVSHLLMHVRQRERSGTDSLEDATDRLLARSACAEGEANLVAIRLLFDGMGLSDEILGTDVEPRDLLGGALVPEIGAEIETAAGELVRFVYSDGFALIAQGYGKDGWRGVEALLARCRTTSDLLHPDRPPVVLPTLSAPPVPLEGLQLVDTDSLGEMGIVVLISTVTGKDNLALIAAAGWAGDRLERWEPEAGSKEDGLTRWITHWRSAEAAADFEYSFSRTLSARFPGRELSETSRGRSLRGAGRVFRIERRGAEVEIRIAGAPTDARLEELAGNAAG